MAPSSTELLRRNGEYVSSHEAMPSIVEIESFGGSAPKTVVITCVDPRIFPERLLGLKLGEAFIFRTVAGHPQAALNDIAALDIETDNGFKDIMIIYHTDCGSLRFDVPKIRAGWKEREPSCSSADVDAMTFGKVDRNTVDETIRKDVEWLKSQPLLRQGQGINVGGFIFDIKTGTLRPVV